MGPTCPACKTRIPLRRTQMDFGKPFCCSGCGTDLVVPRGQNLGFMLGLLTLFVLLNSQFANHWLHRLGLFIGLCALGLPALWLRTQAFRVDSMPPKPADKKKPPKA